MNTTVNHYRPPARMECLGRTEHGDAVEVEVYLEIKCVECDGVGIVQEPTWGRWQQSWIEAGRPPMSEYEVEHPAPEGDEEVACSECDGIGYVLTPAGQALLGFMQRHPR